jgi:hypothetical protein
VLAKKDLVAAPLKGPPPLSPRVWYFEVAEEALHAPRRLEATSPAPQLVNENRTSSNMNNKAYKPGITAFTVC